MIQVSLCKKADIYFSNGKICLKYSSVNELSLVFVSMPTPGSPGVFISVLLFYFSKMKIVPLFLLLFSSWLAGCSKNSSPEDDAELPVITLTTPADGFNFTPGQSIDITGGITDNKYIAEVHIHVTNTNTNTLLMDVHQYPGSTATSFNQSITAVAGINYRIQVRAIDRAVNEATKTVQVTCN